jgi:hypothetical protein
MELGTIGQAHSGAGRASKQLGRSKVLRLVWRRKPDKVAGGAGNNDVDRVGGDGQSGPVQTKLVDGGWIATRRFAERGQRSDAGERWSDGAGPQDIDRVGGLVGERKAGDGWPRVSVTVVVSSCGTPCVTTPFVLPLASARLIDLGGQVEKYPAEEAVCAMVAVITVVPGCCAVMTLVAELIVATAELPTGKAERADGGGALWERIGRPGAQRRVCVPLEL